MPLPLNKVCVCVCSGWGGGGGARLEQLGYSFLIDHFYIVLFSAIRQTLLHSHVPGGLFECFRNLLNSMCIDLMVLYVHGGPQFIISSEGFL